MSNPRHDHDLALLAAGYHTGFWDEYGRPAPWPDGDPSFFSFIHKVCDD